MVGLALAFVAPSALAQGDNQGGAGGTGGTGGAGGAAGGTGTAGGAVGAQAGATVTPPQVTTTTQTTKTTTTAPPPEAAKEEDTTTDHEKFVGHFAIGYLGLTNLPLGGGGDPAAVNQQTVPAPVIGGRYWVNKLLGIDAGIGFALASSSNEVENNNTTTTTDGPSILGLAFHGGVPLALATGKHYTFEVIPEANIGFTSQTVHAPPNSNQPDLKHSGFRLDVGARAGAEVNFGFIGVPELALQATVGLFLQRQVWHSSMDSFGNTPQRSSSISQTGIGTSVQSDPWALFVNNISALYYF